MRVGRGARGLPKGILAVLVLAFVLASCASRSAHPAKRAGGRPAGTTTATTTATTIKTFAAYDAAGDVTITVGDVATGTCFTASVAAAVPGAYRCFAAGNTILDPCFAPPGNAAPTSLACVADPWSKAIVLTLTSPLPAVQPLAGTGRPWALQLASGVRCVASTGTVPSVRGVALTYRCTDGSAAAIDDAGAAALIATYGRPSGTSLQHQAVRTVWRG